MPTLQFGISNTCNASRMTNGMDVTHWLIYRWTTEIKPMTADTWCKSDPSWRSPSSFYNELRASTLLASASWDANLSIVVQLLLTCFLVLANANSWGFYVLIFWHIKFPSFFHRSSANGIFVVCHLEFNTPHKSVLAIWKNSWFMLVVICVFSCNS
jgi:hypothetical protein